MILDLGEELGEEVGETLSFEPELTPYEEIAAVMGLSVPTVISIEQSALRKVANYLGKGAPIEMPHCAKCKRHVYAQGLCNHHYQTLTS